MVVVQYVQDLAEWIMDDWEDAFHDALGLDAVSNQSLEQVHRTYL